MNERDNFLYVFIGGNRTGKSVTARKHAVAWKKANPGKLIIGYDPQRRFQDLIDVHISPEDEFWAVKLQRFRNSLIIIDEVKQINENPVPVKGFKTLLAQRCDWNLDIITIFHNPGDVLNCISALATHYFIFFTNTKEGAFQAKIPNYMLCVIASKEVNKHVSIFGKGNYSIKDKMGNEQIVCNFPHIIVDGEKQTLEAINMSKIL